MTTFALVHSASVFRIHEILVRIRIRGSIPLIRIWIRMRIRILLFSSVTFNQQKNFSKLLCSVLLKGTFTSFFKDKKSKRVTNSRNQGFSYYFSLMIEGSGSVYGSGSVPLTHGSGSVSQRPKNIWILVIPQTWIRIRNTAPLNPSLTVCKVRNV